MFAKILFPSSVEKKISGEENYFLQMLGKNNSTCETSWKKKVWAGVILSKRFQTILFFLEIFLFIHV